MRSRKGAPVLKQTENRKQGAAGEPESTQPVRGAEPTGGTEKAKQKPEAAKEKETAGKAAEKETPKDALKEKLKETENQLARHKDQLLRTAAEYDNYRKRTEREKTMVYTDATAAAVLEFLPVADNLSRALEQKECGSDDLRRGIEMVQKQMDGALSKLGVTELGKEGDPFDPELHNAVSHVEDENAGENTVVKVFQKGYRIGDRIVRHAMVQVAN